MGAAAAADMMAVAEVVMVAAASSKPIAHFALTSACRATSKRLRRFSAPDVERYAAISQLR